MLLRARSNKDRHYKAERRVVVIASDEDDGDLSLGDLSLRELIIAANADSKPIYNQPSFISMELYSGAAEDAAAGGDLDITSEITIIGSRATNTALMRAERPH